MTPEYSKLHERALSLVNQYRKSEALLLEVLTEIDRKKAYLPLGYSSLFQYCVGALNLSESQSYAFMSVSRKSFEVPELKAAIENNEITLSNARRLVSVITPENQSGWLEKGKTLSQKELEREIVKENPHPPVMESIRPVSAEESELRVGLDNEMLAELKRVQALVGTGSLKVALKTLLKNYLKRQDPIEKARRNHLRKETLGANTVGSTPSTPVARPLTRAIPKAVVHEVNLRDHGLCQFEGSNGQKCLSPYWTQLHHLEPRAYGGRHEKNNLLTLCHRHHEFWHRN